ncbi:S24 family peptidase, partial [Paraburkholderia fungorum]|uniref:S24 family peptidase n=1 Tax=Paraburkholderia fungorum TaxID=134537 RepID=UPI0038B9B087
MKTTISRLKFAVLDREKARGKRILKKDLAAAAGVSSPAVTNWWNNENTELEARCVFGLAKFLEISPEWLQSGRGRMLDLLANHISADAESLKSRQKSGVIVGSAQPTLSNMEGEPRERFDKNVTPAPLGQHRIPVISYVQAGMMTEALDPFSLGEGFETITVDFPCSEHTFALRIKGRSMLPTFEEDDVIVVDPLEQPVPGSFVVAKNTDEEATFKKYKALGANEYGDAVFELVPLNDDFATLHSQRDHLRIVGVAVEHRKKLLKQSAR